MHHDLTRRQFAKSSLAVAASIGVSPAYAAVLTAPVFTEALVIGSGFGGAVASLRLGEAGIETILLERGRRWRVTEAGDTFCTKENPDGRSTWLSNTTILPAPIPDVPIDVYTGVLDRTVGNGATAYRGAGVGGGSLVYAGITFQPTKALFERVFPSSISYDELSRIYYPRVRSILNASPIPDDILQNDAFLQSRIALEQAAKAGLKTIKPDMAFDWNIVRQEIAGEKTAGVIAGEIYYGTSSGAKNSLDRNYLRLAEETGHVEILPLHVVTSIAEVDGGRHQVVCNQINEQGAVLKQTTFVCRYLFLAAGSIGTSELLLRAKANRTLRNLNGSVGKFWGTNADSLGAMITSSATNPTLGTAGVVAIEHLDNPIAPVILEPFQAEPSIPQGVAPYLGIGISKPEGFLTYNTSTQSADLFWPANSADSQRNAQAVQYTYQLLNSANGTALAGPIDHVDIAHPVGGAVMGKVCSDFGQVYGYDNLFVVDGSLIPGSAACANPSLTIAALAERSMDLLLNRRSMTR